MAIANSDGSIILSTKVDTSGMEKGTKSLKSQAAKLAAEYRKAGMSQSEAFKKAWSEINRTRKETEKATKSTQIYGEKAKTAFQGVGSAFQGVGSALKSLAGHLALAFSVTKIIQFGNEAINLASDLQEVQNVVDTAFGNMSYKIEDFSKTSIEQFGLSELAAKQWASTMMAMGSGMGQSMEIGSDMAVELTGRLADVMSFYNKTEEEAFTLGKAIYSGETEPLKSIGIIMTENNLSLFAMSKGYKQAYKDMDATNKLLVRQQYFLEQTSLAAGDYTKTADGWANQTRTLSQRWKEMQTVFGETFISLGVLVLPIIQKVIDGLKQIAVILKYASIAFGIVKKEVKETNYNTQQGAENTNKTAENIKKQAENQKDLNKEMKKTLAGFDDLQILTSGSSNDASSEALDTIQNSVNEVTNLTDVEDSTLSFDPMAIVEELKSAIDFILPVIITALVVIGLIVLSTGNIGLGIGFIAAGAYLYSVTERSEGAFDFNVVKKDLEVLKDNLEIVLTAIGVILLFLGQIPFGVGFIVAGAVVYGVKEVSTEEYSTATTEEKLAVIGEAVSLGLVAIGIILIFLGNYGFGVGFIITGAYLYDVSEEKLDEGAISTKIENMFNEFGQYIKYSSYALIWLGVVLLCFGVINQISIGLIAAGAVGLDATAEMSGTTILDMIKGDITSVIEYIQSHGFAMVVIGLLAMLTGAGLLPGLALIGIGISGMVQGKDATTNNIVGWIKKSWEAVKTYWNTYIAPVFTLEWWANLGKNCINGFIKSFETGINAIITMFESMLNFVITAFNKISFDVPEWVPEIGGKKFGFDFDEVDLERVSIPKLATGAVIPPNREFLAVLGDNTKEHEIVSPVSTMKQSFMEAMVEMGGNFGGGKSEIILEIDGREFGRAVVEQGNRENRRIGTRLVIV